MSKIKQVEAGLLQQTRHKGDAADQALTALKAHGGKVDVEELKRAMIDSAGLRLKDNNFAEYRAAKAHLEFMEGGDE